MNPVPWDIIKELVHFIGYILLGIWVIKLLICLITEVFSKKCQ